MITNEERLFKIEQEQKGLQEQLTAPPSTETKQEGLITTLAPQPDFVSELNPLYPVLPFGSSTSTA
jgi:hypothetical protein